MLINKFFFVNLHFKRYVIYHIKFKKICGEHNAVEGGGRKAEGTVGSWQLAVNSWNASGVIYKSTFHSNRGAVTLMLVDRY